MDQRSNVINAVNLFKNSRSTGQLKMPAQKEIKSSASLLRFSLVVFYAVLVINLLGLGL